MKKTIAFLLALVLSLGGSRAATDVDLVVAADGSGDFTTVQAAIDAVPPMRNKPTRILIKKGVYKEKLVIAPCKAGVHFIGEDGATLCYDDYNARLTRFGETTGTSGSSAIFIYGNDFYAENVTFQNTAGPVGQAVACFVSGDRAEFRRCRFLGFQDTLYTFGEYSRQYYADCYIEGTVDFIFGKATAFFDRCHIHSKGRGYVTAPATPQGHAYGYVFRDCRLTADEGVAGVYLSRPWRPYGQTVFVNCYLGSHILPEGWNNWGDPDNERTAYYAEYHSYGPGANPARRVAYSHQLSSASAFTPGNVLAGSDGWKAGER